MTSKNLRDRFIRLTMTLAVGGTAFQLSGCDSRVRATLLTGLEETTQSLSEALISAFFISLDDEDGGTTTTTGGGLTTT